ncbi:DUF4920 domain-containing protein [Desulfopila aestuarii]|uniref:DUF4920 domain-containing protein n=1 Tax=Desulfopila aestuarii DSM 18488 TaxID=1121416 RepID=A0A1M7Y6F8_9BACT|nr:DUF4920 domain-containing protein [Desulfopila aestuarii]SHO48098.1 protein of unknown function [Desulfopila aestuarii DSM 18488]
MKRMLLPLLLSLMLLSTPAFAKTYGKGVHVDKATPVSAILDTPDNYLGKTVKIEGLIVEVCSKRGCWIYVAGDRPEEKIQVKVTDGEIVFPMSATGRVGVIEGIVDEVVMSKEEMIKYQEHLAQEKGKPFDPSSISDGARFIRLIGLGAEINE